MGAAKLCQNSHLIRTSEWKLRICAISTLSAAISPSFPAFSQYFIILQTHRLDSPPPTPSPFPCPCPAALRRACPRPQCSHREQYLVCFGLWFSSSETLKKGQLAFPRCISRNKAFQEGYAALVLPERCNGTHVRL